MKTGAAASFNNREALRIVDNLRNPDQMPGGPPGGC